MAKILIENIAQRASTLVTNPTTGAQGYIYYFTGADKFLFVTKDSIIQKCPSKNWVKNHQKFLVYDKKCYQ